MGRFLLARLILTASHRALQTSEVDLREVVDEVITPSKAVVAVEVTWMTGIFFVATGLSDLLLDGPQEIALEMSANPNDAMIEDLRGEKMIEGYRTGLSESASEMEIECAEISLRQDLRPGLQMNPSTADLTKLLKHRL